MKGLYSPPTFFDTTTSHLTPPPFAHSNARQRGLCVHHHTPTTSLIRMQDGGALLPTIPLTQNARDGGAYLSATVHHHPSSVEPRDGDVAHHLPSIDITALQGAFASISMPEERIPFLPP